MASISYLHYLESLHNIIEAFNPFKSRRLLHSLMKLHIAEISDPQPLARTVASLRIFKRYNISALQEIFEDEKAS